LSDGSSHLEAINYATLNDHLT